MKRIGLTIRASTAGETIAPRVGSVAIATRECALFALGEAGVCYETYRIGDVPGYSFLFERGGFDGFSLEEVALCLRLTGEVAPELAGYAFSSVAQLREDWRQGRFVPVFARARTGRGGRA